MTHHPAIKHASLSIPLWIVMLGILTLMAAVYWAVLGFHTTGLLEEWTIYAVFDQHGVTLDTLLTPSQPDRPFLKLIYALGYLLTPGGFLGLQLFGLMLFIGSGLALYGIVRELWPDNPVIAFIAAALFVIYPADTGTFNSRYYSYSLAVFAYLIAVYWLIRYWRHRHWWLVVGMGGALLISLGSYETAYPLVFVTPLILLWLDRRLSRRLAWVATVWYAIPLATLIASVVILSASAPYQTGLLNANVDPAGVRLLNDLSYEIAAYGRVLIGGWSDILHQVWINSIIDFTIASAPALAIALISFVIVWKGFGTRPIFVRSADVSAPGSRMARLRQALIDRRASIMLFGAGLLVIGLGFIVYAPLPTHRILTDRVYMFSAIGGALCVSVILYGLAALVRRCHHLVLALLFTLIFSLAAVNAIGRAVSLHYESGQEQKMLGQLAEQLPGITGDSAIVIFDPTKALTTNLWRFGIGESNSAFQAAVHYILGQPFNKIRICYAETGIPGGHQCNFTADGIHTRPDPNNTYEDPFEETFPYRLIIAFDYEPASGFTRLATLPESYQNADSRIPSEAYNPDAQIDPTVPLAPATFTLLEGWPYVPYMPHSLLPRRSIMIDFQDPQTMPITDTFQFPLLSDGWLGSWNMSTTASLHILLAQGRDYHFTFNALSATTSAIMNSVTITVNGQAVHMAVDSASAADGVTFGAFVPRAVISLSPNDTLIEFHTSNVISAKALGRNTDPRTRGVDFNWLRITPLS